jgi:hypothetical protein
VVGLSIKQIANRLEPATASTNARRLATLQEPRQ